MRVIDADALIERIKEYEEYAKNNTVLGAILTTESVIDMVEKAPTLETLQTVTITGTYDAGDGTVMIADRGCEYCKHIAKRAFEFPCKKCKHSHMSMFEWGGNENKQK